MLLLVSTMMWVRALVFTILVPGFIAFLAPRWIAGPIPLAGGRWQAGWTLIVLGAVLYLIPLSSFLAAGGTPAIFFTRPLRAVLGEEPPVLVRGGLYRYSRNPMYTGVVLAVLGQAVVFAAASLVVYAVALFGAFYLVVVFLEEPHLRRRDPGRFSAYCRSVPRWLGLPKP